MNHNESQPIRETEPFLSQTLIDWDFRFGDVAAEAKLSLMHANISWNQIMQMMVDILTYCKHLKKLHIEFSCATTLKTAEIFLSEKKNRKIWPC